MLPWCSHDHLSFRSSRCLLLFASSCTEEQIHNSRCFLFCYGMDIIYQPRSRRLFLVAIVNRGDWLWSPTNIKRGNKDAKIYVGRSTSVHNLLFCTECINHVTKMLLLVSSSVRSKQLLCFVQGQGQKREQKHTTKNFELSGFITIPLY